MVFDRTRMHRLQLLLLSLIVCWGPTAFAQDEDEPAPEGEVTEASAQEAGPSIAGYVVAVSPDPELQGMAGRVGAAARGALRGVQRVTWAGPDRTYLAYGDYVAERLTRARERLAAGKQAYLNMELGQAMEHLGGAVQDFETAIGALEDPTDFAEALMLLGASQVFENRLREARRSFERMHVQMPFYIPNPSTYPPDVISHFERARPRDAAHPQSSITVSEPEGAVVYVDYVARGRAPMTVEGLVGGDHVVRVMRPGATPYVQPVSLRPGASETVEAFIEGGAEELATAAEQLREHSLERIADGDALSRLGAKLEVGLLGVIVVSAGEGEGQVQLRFAVFDTASGDRLATVSSPARTAIGELEPDVGQLVVQGMDAAFLALTAEPEVDPCVADPCLAQCNPDPCACDDPFGLCRREEPEIWEQWWFWAGVGGAVVVGAVVAIAIAASGGGSNTGGGQIVIDLGM